MSRLACYFAVLTALVSPIAMATTESTFTVTVHPYGSDDNYTRNYAYEYGTTASENAIIFINGLYGGPHTNPFVRRVADQIQKAQNLSYSVFEIRLNSAFTAFGAYSIFDDAADISVLVKYLRSIRKRNIVLYGHSSGCQDCMAYIDNAKHDNPSVDGFILQAPVSDREYLQTRNFYHRKLDAASKLIEAGKPNECIPREGGVGPPLTAYRVYSLYAKGGDEDFFSSDLSNETVTGFWQRFQKPVLVLFSENDQFVPQNIDQKKKLQRYREANPQQVSQLSGLIPNATHSLVGDTEAHGWLADKVEAFLRTL
ncbi:hypothetical protein CDD81_6787 [Ophiocordyceps australis]|uniref:DUF1749 domain-containing protein n=1 Tax=Ophiocordyceps australis TaxID=1399860 RepID=A0A2C5XHE4_9HYPO|nr:hypothetical protein CDD81_6787 [Ophiocordyceps australis]